MIVETRLLSKRSRPLDDWSIPLPPGAEPDDSGGLTLRELITRVVRHEVHAFEKRDKARRLLRVLSNQQIEDGAARGKVDLGGRPSSGPVDADQAVAAALQGFEDGLYLVILDGVEQRDLEAQVFVNDQSRMVFLRLTFLAGA
jgi:hypothetical protein